MVTDGEPTAHLEDFDGDGSSVFFDYPPHPRTIAHTVRGFDDMARLGAQVTIFRLGSDPGLARFIDQVARRVEGRVVVPDSTDWARPWSATTCGPGAVVSARPTMATASRATAAWNTLGYLLYVVLVVVGALEVWVSLFFAMATDACHDSACDASYHVWPAMIAVWVGVGAVLLLTLIVMLRKSSRGNAVIGWPLLGLLGLGLVYVIADAILH